MRKSNGLEEAWSTTHPRAGGVIVELAQQIG
jgi:hypothetical protein